MKVQESTDEELMAAYAAGRTSAFRTLFDRLAPRVHGFFRRSFNQSVADDLMQTTFLRLHRYRDRFDPSRPLRPWLFTIAASVRRDELRRIYRLPEHAGEDELERAEAQSQSRADPDGEKDFRAEEAVRAAIEKLPETQRVVLHLHRFEGLTFVEIAQALDTTPGAVRVRACRAYERLRQELEHLVATESGDG